MKLRSIRLENVRRFDAPVQLDGIGDGLNVLSEPNEHGKSTLFDALQALFLRPHGSKAEDIRALRPHSGGAPEVAVEIETGEGRFTLSKRWWSKPFARVEQAGRLIAQADEAEDWIGRLTGGDGGGPAGLLWVRQGLTGLSDGSRKEQDSALAARRDLLSSVTGEVEAMTGGRRMDAALARCADELREYCTATGKPKVGGPWKAAQDEAQRLVAEEAELAENARALHEALTERKRKRRALAEIEEPEAAAARTARLEEAEAAFRAAERHAERVEAERRRVQAAEGQVRDIKVRLDTLRATLAERAAAAKAAETAAQAQESARSSAVEAETALDDARRRLAESGEALAAAETAHGAALRRQAARDGAARRAELAERLEAAEAARAAMEEAAAIAARGPDAPTLRRLEELDAEARTARVLRDAAAPQVVMHYAAGRAGTVTRDGAPLPDAEPVPVPEGAALELHGLGRLTVRPGAGPQAADEAEAAARALFAALKAAGAASLAEAREAAAERADAERRMAEARARAEVSAPQGIEALRAALAAIPAAVPDDDEAADPADTEAAVAAARTARAGAEARRDAAESAASEARSRAARAEAAAEAATARLTRAEAALGRLEERDETALSEALLQATTALRAAEAGFEQAARNAPDLAAAEAALRRARAVAEQAQQTAARLRPEIAALDERIARSSGEAVEERLAETRDARRAADARLARIEREVAILRRLEAALQGARSEARERYFEPVARELRPLLNLLWPEADLLWGEDTLLPRALIRAGQQEPVEILSGGTQEQLALLVRLAFARMLAKAGRHAPVILDDALVFTDDDRIERMFDALHRQAGDLQILVLSCRQRAFRDLGGRLLRLEGGRRAEDAA